MNSGTVEHWKLIRDNEIVVLQPLPGDVLSLMALIVQEDGMVGSPEIELIRVGRTGDSLAERIGVVAAFHPTLPVRWVVLYSRSDSKFIQCLTSKRPECGYSYERRTVCGASAEYRTDCLLIDAEIYEAFDAVLRLGMGVESLDWVKFSSACRELS